MTGLEEFLKVFGNITVLNVVEVVLSSVFLYFIYKKVRDYLVKKYDAEKQRDAQLKEALDAVRKYPEYRQQSINIQQKLEAEIQALRESQQANTDRLMQMEEMTQRRERNKLQDRLLQNYRYYTSDDHNPSKSWTRMESESFMGLFSEYEAAGGNGFMHSVVQPEMLLLTVVEMDDIDGIAALMKTRR